MRSDKLVRGRRPADVWFSSWKGDGPAAIDFAVTSGLRNDLLNAAVTDTASICGAYENFKRGYLNTEAECQERGLVFLPFIMEAHGGGFGPTARKVLGQVARAGAAKEGEEVEEQAAGLMRRMSISLQRENARSVLRRLPGLRAHTPGAAPEVWAENVQSTWQ